MYRYGVVCTGRLLSSHGRAKKKSIIKNERLFCVSVSEVRGVQSTVPG